MLAGILRVSLGKPGFNPFLPIYLPVYQGFCSCQYFFCFGNIYTKTTGSGWGTCLAMSQSTPTPTDSMLPPCADVHKPRKMFLILSN